MSKNKEAHSHEPNMPRLRSQKYKVGFAKKEQREPVEPRQVPTEDPGFAILSSGRVRIRLDMTVENANELWRKIFPHYRSVTDKVNIFNQYVRELIYRDCGVDVAKHAGRSKYDPLTDPKIVQDLFAHNPGKFSHKQIFMLEMRAQGYGVTEIHNACMERIAKGKFEPGGCGMSNISRWFNVVRRALGFDY